MCLQEQRLSQTLWLEVMLHGIETVPSRHDAATAWPRKQLHEGVHEQPMQLCPAHSIACVTHWQAVISSCLPAE